MKLYGYLLLLLLAAAAHAQDRVADSSAAAIHYNARPDLSRTPPVLTARDRYPSVNRPPISFHRADSSLAASHRLGNRQGEVDALQELASYYVYEKGQLAPALRYIHQAQQLAVQLGDQKQLACLIRQEGLYYSDMAEFEQAAEALCRSLMLMPASAPGMRAHTLARLSQMYATLDDEPEAARYERLCVAYLPRIRTDSITFDTCSVALMRLGISNEQRKHWAASERYLRQALTRAPYIRPSQVMEINVHLASGYNLQYKPYESLRCLRPYVAAITPDTLNANNYAIRLCLAAAYSQIHQLDSAALHGRVALALVRRTHNKLGAFWIYRVMASITAQQHDYAHAWEYQRLSTAYQDSVHIEESGYRMAFNRHNTALAQQQTRVALLTKDQELAHLRQQRVVIGLALLAVLLAGGIGAAVYAVRQRQRRREATLRQRLAADLHDEVGSLLTRLSLESSLLSEGLRPPQEQQRQLSALVSVSQQALRQMRDVVWSIRPDHDSLPHVLDQMREHGHDLLGAAGLEFDFHAEPDVAETELPALARQHLYLIYKEALHNAVKHAQGATLLTVRLVVSGLALRMTVRDDGAGTTCPGRPSSHGLANMRQRAEELGGTVAYHTAPGQGFTVEVLLPLAGQRLHPATPPPAVSPPASAFPVGWQPQPAGR